MLAVVMCQCKQVVGCIHSRLSTAIVSKSRAHSFWFVGMCLMGELLCLQLPVVKPDFTPIAAVESASLCGKGPAGERSDSMNRALHMQVLNK
jgi:hypothetical protein